MLTEHYDRLTIAPGALLFAAGDFGTTAYLIEQGCVEIFLERADGELVLARREVGEIVGEMGLLDRRPRSASVRAITETSLIVITQESMERRLDHVDPILKMCLGVVLDRYRETIGILNQMRGQADKVPGALAAPKRFTAEIETLVMEREMKVALERRQFELHYQPIINLKANTIAGFEALMRWRHPVHGMMPPNQFIPLAEESGFISYLTDWALSELATVFPRLMLLGLSHPTALSGPLFISVNISGHDLNRAHFAKGLAESLIRAGIPPSSLKLELTESVLMKDPDGAAAMLMACREGGVGIAIDDFGTGYSSLSYLSTLPITTLKIDRSFVHAMLADVKSRKIVQTIVRLADELGIPVVAEGIEHQAEARILTDMGCALGQGFLFGRPVPIESAFDLIRTWAEHPPLPARAIA